MTECEDIHGIGCQLLAVQGHIARVPECNHQLAKLWNFNERTANIGGCFQQQELPLNGLTGPLRSLRGLGVQEPPASFQALRRAFCNDYLWYSGAAFSSSVPQVFNQVRTFWPVKCRPVSSYAAHDATASCLKLSRASSRSTYCWIASSLDSQRILYGSISPYRGNR